MPCASKVGRARRDGAREGRRGCSGRRRPYRPPAGAAAASAAAAGAAARAAGARLARRVLPPGSRERRPGGSTRSNVASRARAEARARRAPARLPVGGGAIWPIVQPLGGGRGWLAVLYAAEGQFWGAVTGPGGCRRCPQPGQPAPPAEAGRSPLDHSHEESSWCSWRPLEWRARADGGKAGDKY